MKLDYKELIVTLLKRQYSTLLNTRSVSMQHPVRARARARTHTHTHTHTRAVNESHLSLHHEVDLFQLVRNLFFLSTFHVYKLTSPLLGVFAGVIQQHILWNSNENYL